ncbi:LuxR C-terminal-related transcriptional regulator [Chloroflexota bacterium]
MSGMLLKTKLHIPPRPNLVPRPHLLHKLNEGVQSGRRLTLISAPAGFGKTTLLSEWISQQDRPVAWLSIDEGDNDISRFFSYLVAALQSIDLNIGEAAPGILQSSQPPPVEVILTPLINTISDFADPIILILDDYHAIESQFIHDALAFLITHSPAPMHLILTTREDPPLPISHLRGRGQLTELRVADLRFTSQEVVAFLKHIMGLDISAEDIATLERRTEGWIAGLQMAAISMKSREDIAGFIAAFSGSHEFIVDYLTDEVLNQQPEDLKKFLLQTSILNRMTGPLCDAITERANGQQTLEQLKENNLFVVSLDDERRWYRYHHLFGDLLGVRLQADYPNQVLELHRRAALWYEHEGITSEAVEHALKANDFDLAADILERSGKRTGLWSTIQVATLIRWLQTLPGATLNSRPWLRFFAARAYAHAGRFEEAERGLHELEQLLESNPEAISDADLMAEHLIGNQAVYASFRGQSHKAIELARHALDRVSEENVMVHIRASRALGYAYINLGNLAQASRAIRQSINKALSKGVWSAVVSGTYHLASLQIIQGQLRLAIKTCKDAGQWNVIDGKRLPADGLLGLPYGKILYEQNQLAQAENRLMEDLRLLNQHGITDYFGLGHALLARIKQGSGDSTGALNLMQRARYIAEASNLELYISRVAAYQAQCWLAQGQLTLATRWAKDYRQSGETEYLRMFEDLVLVRVLLADNQADEALQTLDLLLPPAEEAGSMGWVIEMLALQALAFQLQGELENALFSLERALNLAEPEGYVRTFVDEGDPMAHLLYEAASRGIAPDYAGRLLASFPEPIAESDRRVTARQLGGELIESLSERELEVLKLIAEGQSNREVAQQLVISLPTVKSHTSNIYSKLAVSSRTQAVDRARKLGILPRH